MKDNERLVRIDNPPVDRRGEISPLPSFPAYANVPKSCGLVWSNGSHARPRSHIMLTILHTINTYSSSEHQSESLAACISAYSVRLHAYSNSFYHRETALYIPSSS